MVIIRKNYVIFWKYQTGADSHHDVCDTKSNYQQNMAKSDLSQKVLQLQKRFNKDLVD